MQLIKQAPYISSLSSPQKECFIPLLTKEMRDIRNEADYEITKATLQYLLIMPGISGKNYPVREEFFLLKEHAQIYKKEEKSVRKRFDKTSRFLYKERGQIIDCLPEIFRNFHLDDFREELNLWRELALCNDQSAYDTGYAREDLMDFIRELHTLIEAFHLVNEKANQHQKNKTTLHLSKQTRKLLSGLNIPVSLSEEQKARPYLVISRFCKSFGQEYVKMELLDLLDAVITYEGSKEINKSILVLFYQHLQFLTGLAYNLAGSFQEPGSKEVFKKISG
jgi:hypothetical protein